MVIELTTLHIRQDSIANFQVALPKALEIIRCAEGHLGHQVDYRKDDPCRWLLMIRWRSKEDAIDRIVPGRELDGLAYERLFDYLPAEGDICRVRAAPEPFSRVMHIPHIQIAHLYRKSAYIHTKHAHHAQVPQMQNTTNQSKSIQTNPNSMKSNFTTIHIQINLFISLFCYVNHLKFDSVI